MGEGAPLRAIDRLRAQAAAPPPGAPPDPGARRRRGRVGGALAVVAALLAKGKALLLLLGSKAGLLLGAASKFSVTAWTMLLMAGVYARLYGWSLGVGVVLLILIHEMGHAAAARAVGIPVSAPVFIPFFGAFITMKQRPRTVWQEHVVAAGRSLIGGAAAAACVALSMTGLAPAGLFLAIGYVGLMLNLFNLTPIWQLDGARMLRAVDWRHGLVALGVAAAILAAVAMATSHLNPIALLALVIGGWQLVARGRRQRRGAPASALARLSAQIQPGEPTAATPAQRWIALAVYTGALVALAVAVQLLQARMPAPT